MLERRGQSVVSVRRGSDYRRVDGTRFAIDPASREHWARLFREAFVAGAPRRIVHLESLDVPDGVDEDALARGEAIGCRGVLHLVQALGRAAWKRAPRLFLVTRGAQPPVRSPAQALLWGFGATVAQEMPELEATLVDLEAGSKVEELLDELARADRENRVALREGARAVPRLVRSPVVRADVAGREERTRVRVSETVGYRLDPASTGNIDSLPGGLWSRAPWLGDPVRVLASWIDFRRLIALGSTRARRGRPPWGECAGRVTAVAPVTELVGDPVVATGVHAFDSHVTVPAERVVRKPEGLGFAQAASVPIVFMTVLQALRDVARLEPGERLLVHAATGGVGLAAIQYAKRVGAEIFATAGSEEKRDRLRALGVRHVFDSRSLAWVEGVLSATNGQGIDVVLTSLAGEAIPKGLEILAPCGRFIELSDIARAR